MPVRRGSRPHPPRSGWDRRRGREDPGVGACCSRSRASCLGSHSLDAVSHARLHQQSWVGKHAGGSGSLVFPERDSCFYLQMSLENEEMRARTRSKALRGECRLPVHPGATAGSVRVPGRGCGRHLLRGPSGERPTARPACLLLPGWGLSLRPLAASGRCRCRGALPDSAGRGARPTQLCRAFSVQ